MSFGLWEIWQSLGPLAIAVVITLLAMSVLAIGIGVERAFALALPAARGRAYENAVQRRLREGDFTGAAKVPAAKAGALASVVAAGLDEWSRSHAEAPAQPDLLDAVEAAMTRQIAAELAKMKRGLGALATIGTTAPFIGLFGTVVGIINSFQGIARTGSGGLGAVSAGIAEALATTAIGILVAIPAVALFNTFTGKVEAAESTLGEAASSLLDAIRKKSWTGRSAPAPVSEAAE
jgi:biopolymer transport protein ExbB/biopolymer transport protein TolQ